MHYNKLEKVRKLSSELYAYYIYITRVITWTIFAISAKSAKFLGQIYYTLFSCKRVDAPFFCLYMQCYLPLK